MSSAIVSSKYDESSPKPQEWRRSRCPLLRVGNRRRGGAIARIIFALLAMTMCQVGSGVLNAVLMKEGKRGVEFFEKGRFEDALRVFQGMEREEPKDYEVLLNIALCMEQLQDVVGAAKYYRKAIKESPQSITAWSALGSLLTRRGEGDEAVEAYAKAIAISPQSDDLHYNRGNAEQARGNHAAAAKDFKRATKLRPTFFEAWNNLGSAYMSLMENKKAIEALRKTLTFIPTHPIPLTNLVVMENRGCDWSRRDKHLKSLKKALYEQIAQGQSLVTPFHSFEFQLSPEECQLNSIAWSSKVEDRISYIRGFQPGGQDLAKGSTRLRIGYFSGSGFHNSTTTARSMQSQYGMHDRMLVEVFCYAGQPDDGSEVRAAIKRGCDKFVDLHGLNFEEMANRIKQDNVNVLIDLTGYTMSMQTEVMAIGPAPVQVSFHGFPGTMGTEFMHYLVADPKTTPPEHSLYYTEKLMILPSTYLTNDHRQSRREVYGTPPHRSEFGFSDDDLVLCSFNQLYKIEPVVFDAWMGLLKAMPNAKLWILRFTDDGAEKLQKYAEKHGVDKNRIIATKQFPVEREFLIKGLADLFLDTPLFNAHTTGGDVLWSGVPILTIPGEGFAQRVASGLVASAGTANTMIARDIQDYKDLALGFLRQPKVLKDITRRLREGRETHPLFDTQLLTADLEKGLRMTWEVKDVNDSSSMFHLVVASREAQGWIATS